MNVSTQPVLKQLRVTVAFAVLSTALVGLTLSAQSPGSDAKLAASRGGPSEGIKVHGHWVIEVRNPNGTLVTRREFENAIDASYGNMHLANLLKQTWSPGHWSVRLGGTRTGFAPPPACTGNAVGGSECWIVEPGSLPSPFNAPGAGISTNLVVNIAGASQDQVIFSGSVTVLTDGKIDYVNTWQGFCGGNIAPQNCTTVTGGPFTYAPLDPISVQQGRIVQVTVTLSFS